MSGHTVTLIRRMRMLTWVYALIAVLYGISAAWAIYAKPSWLSWVGNTVGCVAFVAVAIACQRKSKALMVAEINRKFGVTNE